MIERSSCFIDIGITSNNELTLHLSLPDKVDGWIVNYTHFNKVAITMVLTFTSNISCDKGTLNFNHASMIKGRKELHSSAKP